LRLKAFGPWGEESPVIFVNIGKGREAKEPAGETLPAESKRIKGPKY
jgi:hypothetical protein